MRITTFLLLVCVCSTFATSSHSQNARVTINKTRVPLEEVLDEIENQTDYLFLYNTSVDIDMETTVKVKNKPVGELLDQLFERTGLNYELESTHILLSSNRSVTPAVTQQSHTVTGTVTDETGEPIIGANIVVKGQLTGVISDLNGQFTIQAPPNSKLSISYIGFITEEIPVNGRSVVPVVLLETVESLSEVVVVGYGVQKKVNLTGSVATVKSEQIANRAVTNATNVLTGLVPGVTVIQRSGQPGADGAEITMRGPGTFNSTSPLVIIDGIPGDMGMLNPNDIDEISILKDAASAAIYGVRAANGVVLVTTKQGKQGKMQISYDGYIGFQRPTRIPKWVNSADYALLYNEALVNDGLDPLYSAADIEKYRSGSDPYNYPNSDQTGELFSKNGFQHSHYVTLHGGAERTRFNIALGYMDRQGLIQQTDFDRYSFRGNFDYDLSSRIKFGTNISYTRQKRTQPAMGIDDLVHRSYRETPVTPIKWEDGTWAAFMNEHNSVAQAKEGGYNNYTNNYVTAIGYLEIKLVEGLTAKGVASYSGGFTHQKTQQYNLSLYNRDGSVGTKFRPSIWEERAESSDVNLQAFLNYNKKIDKHEFAGILGFEQRKYIYSYLGASRYDLPGNNLLDQIDAGDASDQRNYGSASEHAIRSAFGRINYNYDERYLLEFTLRYDGSSRFPKENRFAYFPSVSAGWRISEEHFFEVKEISNLKLRASWGKLGNQEIGNYAYFSRYSLGLLYGFGNNMYSGIAESFNMSNSTIGWENTEMMNVGLDVTILNNRLNYSFDYFVRNTKDILMELEQPVVLGAIKPVINAGEVQNKGFEMQVGWNDRINDFQYYANFNLSRVKDEIKDLKGAEIDGRAVGDPINNIYGLEVIGIFQSEEEIRNAPDQDYTGIPSPGDLRYKDQNGDGKITAEDRVNLGNMFPGLTMGLQLGASYKGFDINATLHAVMDVKGYLSGTAAQAFSNGASALEYHLDRWTPDNPNASYPRVSLNNANRNHGNTNSFFMENASYLKMRNAQIGYTLPKFVTNVLSIEKCRIYISADNLFTITSFRGFDPEISNDNGWNAYPNVSSYLFGVNVTF